MDDPRDPAEDDVDDIDDETDIAGLSDDDRPDEAAEPDAPGGMDPAIQRARSRGRRFTPADLTVLYRDDRLIAVDKPSGLLVHHSYIARDVRTVALQLVRRIVGRRVHAVHRLDRGTSGVLLFALDPDAARDTADLFAARRVDKTYYAVVRGHPPAEGRVDHPLNASKTGPRREATTDFTCRAHGELPIPVGRFPTARYGLLELRPHTGRRHQLRRHCCHLSHPIIGDTTYGDGRHNRLFRREFGAQRLLLYAARLRFAHPYTGAPIDLRCGPDPTLGAVCAAFGWPDPLAPPDPQEAAR